MMRRKIKKIHSSFQIFPRPNTLMKELFQVYFYALAKFNMSGSEKFTICISKTPMSYQLYENKKMLLLLLAVFLFNLVILLSIYNFYNGHMINYENSSSADLVRTTDLKVTIKASSDSDDSSFHSITAVSDTFQTEDNVEEHGDNRKEEAEESDSSLQTGVDGAMITANSSVSSEYASNESSHEACSECELPKLNECGRRMIENKNFTEGELLLREF